MVAGAGSFTPDTSSAGYADGSLGTGLAPKSRALARGLSLTKPPVVPGPGRHNRLEEVPEETATVEIEVCLAEQPAPPDLTRIQLIPAWVVVEDPEEDEEEFDPLIVARYRRVVGNFIQIINLHSLHWCLAEYFDHIQERERAFWEW